MKAAKEEGTAVAETIAYGREHFEIAVKDEELEMWRP